jgi:DNA replication protein DnaC
MSDRSDGLVADRIRRHAERLLLHHLAARAEAAQLGYPDFLDQVLEEEVGVREGRRFRNALKLSGLPHHKTLDEFDFAVSPTSTRATWPRWGSSGPART